MITPWDLTMDLVCFRHLHKHTARDSSGPKELTWLTNKIDKVDGQEKGSHLTTSLSTYYQSHDQKIQLLYCRDVKLIFTEVH